MPRIHQLRGGHLEAVHPFSAVAVAGGAVVGALGEDLPSPWRSAAKPFQLRSSLSALPGEGFNDAQLAIGAASHAGEPRHIKLVSELLQRFGLSEVDLRCGSHWPLYHGAGEAVIRGGGVLTNLHSNCSGKHTFMLAACRRQGWDPDYRPLEHPLQRRIHALVTDLSGVAPATAVDGCGVPTFHLPLSAMATAWSVLARAAGGDGDPLLGRIGRAMSAAPELTSGTGRLDVDVMAGAREPMIVKIGAAGVYCMAFPQRGVGLAIKVHSGCGEALGAAAEVALHRLVPGAWSRPAPWPWAEVLNIVGRPVGAWLAEV